jgi:hypothetical protein
MFIEIDEKNSFYQIKYDDHVDPKGTVELTIKTLQKREKNKNKWRHVFCAHSTKH